jgi:hypothetical protein
MIYIAGRIRWALLGFVQGLLGWAFFLHFFEGNLPTRFLEIPMFLGSSSLVLPTLLFATSLLILSSVLVPSCEVFLGLAFNVYLGSCLFGALFDIWICLPKGFKDSLEGVGGGGGGGGVVKKGVLGEDELRRLSGKYKKD